MAEIEIITSEELPLILIILVTNPIIFMFVCLCLARIKVIWKSFNQIFCYLLLFGSAAMFSFL